MARIACVLTLIADPRASVMTEDAMQRSAPVIEFYLGEGIRLADVQPLHERSDQASQMWGWLALRGKRFISLPELVQFGPAKLRKTDTMRSVMDVLADHYMARKVIDGTVEYNGRSRREGWEVRL